MEQNVKKNYAKGNAYALAHQLIKNSIEQGFPLQAITIEESILSDRLWSTLHVNEEKKAKVETLGKALSLWGPDCKKPSKNANLFDEEMLKVKPRLDSWWKDRCAVLHGMVKSFQGEAPEIAAENFILHAAKVAKEGLALVKTVSAWSKKQIRYAKAMSGKTVK